MRIGIGVPERLDSNEWNGFRTAFRDIVVALDEHEKVVFAPGGGDIELQGNLQDPEDPFNQYKNTMALSRDFAGKVEKTKPDAILAFNSMGLFLSERFIYHSSTVPYRKIAELVKGEYPETEHFRRLLEYYRFVGEKEVDNYKKAEKIIVHSRKVMEHIIYEHGIDAEKIVYIARPIPKLYSAKKTKNEKTRMILMPSKTMRITAITW